MLLESFSSPARHVRGRECACLSVKVSVELLNAFDRRANDITYFYESQLRGEAAPVEDIHFHPVEPRTLRASVAVQF
jgi:hypothetical protein